MSGLILPYVCDGDGINRAWWHWEQEEDEERELIKLIGWEGHMRCSTVFPKKVLVDA